MDLNYLKKILKLLDESDSTELMIEEEGIKIKLSKTCKNTQVVQQTVAPAVAPGVPPPPAAQSTPASAAETKQETSAPAADTAGKHTIKAPIVGTFYAAPSPDSPPYVEVGTKVSEGQTLCIIEAMKLMNEIESDVNGVIEEILVENGTPVEFNQPLFVIKSA
jgi:acetyl-CoA carboxylase biotin carboxyl carrier protein